MNRKPIPTLLILILSIGVCLTLLAGTVAADDWVGGLPLTTVQTGTVTGDLYISGNPPSGLTDFNKVVDRTFTLPTAAVAGSGRVKWARLYVSSYCGHMQDAKSITYATKVDWNNDGTWDNTWTETDNPGHAYGYMQGGDYGPGNDNSAFPGHGTGEPYLMLNDHTNRVTSDYLSWYNVTNLIQVDKPTIKVNVNATGSYDGRIKVVELIVAYDDPSSTTQTTYWVNEGHDSCSYYTEDNEETVALGTTTFDTSGLSGITSAKLIADYMASNNGYYGFPTADNDFDAIAKTGSFTNIGLDRIPDAQGSYSGIDSWDVTSSVTNNNSVTLAYSRYLPATGLAQFYKIPLAFLVVKKPVQLTPPPIANFSVNRTSGTAPLAVQFTDASTGTVSSYAWDFNNDGTVDSTQQNSSYTYSTAGTYSVNLTVIGPGGSDSEVKTGYINVTPPVSTNDLSITGMVNTVPASAVFAREANTVTVASIKNTGPALTNVSVAIYASDVSGGTVPVNTTTIASIGNNGTVASVSMIDPTVRNLEGGTVTYTAVVDPNNLIPETNEANNNKSSAAKPLRYNGYKGKGIYWAGESNITTKHTYDLQGNLLSSTQPDSAYKGVGWTTRTETWTAGNLPVPSGSTIEKAYLYFAYNWDQTPGGYPWLNINFNGNILDNGDLSTGNGTLYRDWSNFGAYADYEYGLCVYDVTDKFNPSGNTLDTNPYSSSYNQVALYPSTLVVIYRNSNETRKQIFLNEGCDELGLSQSSYGTTLEEATTYAPFTGMSIDKDNVTNAKLYSFAGSAGTDEGNLLFNGNIVAPLAWQGNSNTASPLVFNATNYITATENVFGIQGTTSGGMDPMQQILVLEYPREPVSAPVANFSAVPTSGNEPLTVQFTDASTGTVSSYAWDFDNDGTVDSTQQSPSHIYNVNGTYTVNLTVIGPEGNDSEVKANYINVTVPLASAPVANFTATPLLGVAPLSVTFTDQSTNSPTSWNWEYNNGSGWVQFSTTKNPTFSFVTAYPYDIRLTATNGGGSDDEAKLHYIAVATGREPLTTVQSGTVSGDLYVSSPTTYATGVTEVTKNFTLPAAAVGNIQWAKLYVNTYSGSAANTFALTSTVRLDGNGDGTFETTLGNETMDIASESTNGNSYPLNDHVNKVVSDYEAQYDVTSLIAAASPAANVKSQAISGKSFDGRIKGVTLIVAYNDPSSTNQTYYWVNHGGDWSNPGNGNTTFNTAGLTSGWVSAESKIRQFSSADANYTFNGVSKTGGGSTPNFEGLNTWDVTGNITTGQSSTLAYSKGSGSYKTTLATLKVKYVTTIPAPVANFTAAPTSGDAPLTVQFTDASTGTISSYAWDFNNDGTVDSIEQSPSYIYSANGTYTVNLTVTGPGGSDSEVKTGYITVNEPPVGAPVANFTAAPTSGNAPLPVQFTDTSTGTVSSYAWDFNNDGVVDSTVQSPSFIYSANGTYTVNLTATGPGGSDSEVKTGYIVVSTPSNTVLTITKTANPTTYTTVGQQITYTYTVTNSGNASISGIKVTDNKTKVTLESTTLAPGASVTGTGTYTIKQDAITAGSVTNSAYATGKNGKTTVTSNTVTATVTAIQSPAINLTKIAKPTTYKKVGQVIKYTYTVTNLGNVPINDIAVADNKNTVVIKNGTLAPGKSVKGTGAYTITQDDITAGSVTNTATATGTFNGNTVTTNTETVTVTAEQTKALKITKPVINTKTYNTTGQMITYNYTVTNSGNVPVSNIAVNDNRSTVVIDSETPLAPGSSVTGIGTYTITLDDIIAGSVTNIANATGTFNENTVTSNTVTATIKAKQSPALTITKAADPSTFNTTGDSITYTYTVTNSGNVPVSDIAVDDDKVSVVTISSDTLAPGASVTGTGTYTITSADIKKGSVTNKATATGTFNGKTVKSKVKATATVTKV